jgi:hypothetical protein
MPPASRPSFARDFPPDPDLDALVEAFARGDYARVRSGGAALEHSSGDEAVRLATRALVERTRPDPLAIALLGLAALMLIVLAAWAIAHGRPPQRGTSPASQISRPARSTREPT